jgi:hypothetical protein
MQINDESANNNEIINDDDNVQIEDDEDEDDDNDNDDDEDNDDEDDEDDEDNDGVYSLQLHFFILMNHISNDVLTKRFEHYRYQFTRRNGR